LVVRRGRELVERLPDATAVHGALVAERGAARTGLLTLDDVRRMIEGVALVLGQVPDDVDAGGVSGSMRGSGNGVSRDRVTFAADRAGVVLEVGPRLVTNRRTGFQWPAEALRHVDTACPACLAPPMHHATTCPRSAAQPQDVVVDRARVFVDSVGTGFCVSRRRASGYGGSGDWPFAAMHLSACCTPRDHARDSLLSAGWFARGGLWRPPVR
jgi:hypothetical protein